MPLSSYSTASHAKGRFFVLLSREKISSNHDTSVLIVFIFSHNMALFLLSFFSFFFCRSSLLLSSSLSSSERQCGCKAEQPQIWGDYIFLKIGLSTHASFSTIIEARLVPCPFLASLTIYDTLWALETVECGINLFLLNSRAWPIMIWILPSMYSFYKFLTIQHT